MEEIREKYEKSMEYAKSNNLSKVIDKLCKIFTEQSPLEFRLLEEIGKILIVPRVKINFKIPDDSENINTLHIARFDGWNYTINFSYKNFNFILPLVNTNPYVAYPYKKKFFTEKEKIEDIRMGILKYLFEVSQNKIRSNTQVMEIIYIMQKTNVFKKKIYNDFNFTGGAGMFPISWLLNRDYEHFNKYNSKKDMIILDEKQLKQLIPEKSIPILEKLLKIDEMQLSNICVYLHYISPHEKRIKNIYNCSRKYFGINKKQLDETYKIVANLIDSRS